MQYARVTSSDVQIPSRNLESRGPAVRDVSSSSRGVKNPDSVGQDITGELSSFGRRSGGIRHSLGMEAARDARFEDAISCHDIAGNVALGNSVVQEGNDMERWSDAIKILGMREGQVGALPGAEVGDSQRLFKPGITALLKHTACPQCSDETVKVF